MGEVIASRYELLEKIGQGGMGDVYRGNDKITGQTVAIKVLKPEIISDNPDLVERFVREGEALRKLNHPNIVKMLDAIQENGNNYLVMEYVGGGSLWDLLKRERQLSPQRVMEIALDLSDALTRAHRVKIIHRDIKPQNVLMDIDGTPRLTDFGVAQMGDRTRMTQSGMLVGTYAYLSPEACNGEPMDERADIWAFGVMLYEMLAGKRPYEAELPAAVLIAILTKPVPDLASLRPDAPPALISLIMRMLEKDPQQRIDSVRVVGTEMEALLRGKTTTPINFTPPPELSRFNTPISFTPPSITSTPHLEGPTVSTPISITPPPASAVTPAPTVIIQEKRTNPLWFVLAAMLPLMIIGAFLFLQNSNNTAPAATSTTEAVAEATPSATIPPVPPVAQNEYMVLVADLEALGTEPRDVSRFIAQRLTEDLEEGVPFSQMRIRRYNGVITSIEQARQVAQEANAPIIIWGNYTDDHVELEVQAGSLEQFKYLAFDRDFVEKTANVRVRLTDEHQQSVAMQVMGVLGAVHAADGNGYGLMKCAAVLDELKNINTAEESGNSAPANWQRSMRFYVSDTAASEENITKAIELAPGNPILYGLRVSIHIRQGNLDAANRDLETMKRLSPQEWSYPYFLEASLALPERNLPRAIQAFNVSIEKRPDDWFPWNFRGAVYYLMGDYEKAKADYAQALALNPDMNFPYVISAMIALREGRISDAQEFGRIIIEEFPDPTFSLRMSEVVYGSRDANIFGSVISALVYTLLGQYDRVLKVSDEALAQLPVPDVYMTKGIAYCNLGDHEAALEAFTQAIELDPDFAILYLMRGGEYVVLRQPRMAQADVEKAKSFNLSDEFMQMIDASNARELDCARFFNYRP